MILISHRGNTNGPISNLENSVPYIEKAFNESFNVEIDLWMIDNMLFLGHNSPTNKIQYSWLKLNITKLWIHCKNIDAMIFLKNEGGFNYFFHNNDLYTLTSNNFIWAHPDAKKFDNAILVMPEKTSLSIDMIKSQKILGICSDYIKNYYDK